MLTPGTSGRQVRYLDNAFDQLDTLDRVQGLSRQSGTVREVVGERLGLVQGHSWKGQQQATSNRKQKRRACTQSTGKGARSKTGEEGTSGSESPPASCLPKDCRPTLDYPACLLLPLPTCCFRTCLPTCAFQTLLALCVSQPEDAHLTEFVDDLLKLAGCLTGWSVWLVIIQLDAHPGMNSLSCIRSRKRLDKRC